MEERFLQYQCVLPKKIDLINILNILKNLILNLFGYIKDFKKRSWIFIFSNQGLYLSI